MCVFHDTGTQCLSGIYKNIRFERDKTVLLPSFAFIWLFEEMCECEPAWRGIPQGTECLVMPELSLFFVFGFARRFNTQAE